MIRFAQNLHYYKIKENANLFKNGPITQQNQQDYKTEWNKLTNLVRQSLKILFTECLDFFWSMSAIALTISLFPNSRSYSPQDKSVRWNYFPQRRITVAIDPPAQRYSPGKRNFQIGSLWQNAERKKKCGGGGKTIENFHL